ncbi:hypothetical protein [Bradyrhizobium sp.]|uniref:hypothetical protein n=1 Tax=Bradyrhizobium sp. TaxID=376 RepID=UPI003C4E3353
MLAESLDVQAARDSNGDGTAWRMKPISSLLFVNGAGELDQKHRPARYLRHAARSRGLRAADELRHHGALVPKRIDHREA